MYDPNVNTIENIPDLDFRSILNDMHLLGRSYFPNVEGKDALLIGACKMIGELQQEVSNLKSQLNIIEKNL